MGLESDGLNEVIEHLLTFTSLKKVSLRGCNINRTEMESHGETLVNLTEKLLLLEELKVARMPMKEETLIDIVRFGRQLKVLHVYWCELNFCDELILKLADALKCNRQESDEPLQLLLREEDFLKLDATKSQQLKRYIQLQQTTDEALKPIYSYNWHT